MALRRKRSKVVPFTAADIANIAKSNPYIQSVLEDPKLRKNVTTAVNSGKSAVERVNNGKIQAQALLEDKKLHSEVGRALGAARDAAITLTYAKRRRRKGLTFGRVVLLAAIGGGAAIATSEQLRSKVLDVLFGAEEEFQYTPPATSSSSGQTTTVGAA